MILTNVFFPFVLECVAHSLERPLMVLSTSDIGINAAAVETNLAEQFKRAKSWNAVLLIDEADVFLSQRSIKDLYRNSLVASKSSARLTLSIASSFFPLRHHTLA